MTDRSARLAALAARAGRTQLPIEDDGGGGGGGSCGDDRVTASNGGSTKRPTLSFRNYVPKDASLDDGTKSSGGVSAAPLDFLGGDGDGKSPTGKRRRRGDDKQSKTSSVLELALARTSRESREAAGQNVGAGGWGSVTPMATRKVNWDLKRDIQHKMDKLETRTQRAIVELLRERLEREAREGGNDGSGEGDSDLD
ncbi:hypothetical protein ACHAXA_009816 [Cyclostephanos tholiformis]|jgi:coiled-coil domain-containing protein 12|uniref:Uncharacterized protein n=1 Tax=Cyclostephanos tholiformis TaxID=382380 RepID=A0ABD3RAU7_9STRA